MKSKQFVLGILFILSTLIISSCSSPTAPPPVVVEPSITPIVEGGHIFPTPTSPETAVEAPEGVWIARDAALHYVFEQYGEQVYPPPGMDWIEENITSEGSVGSTTYRFTAGDLMVIVSFPLVAPDATIYQVLVENIVTGFRWEGEIDAFGQVTEPAAPGVTSVVGWYGYVVSTPDGAQFDDFVTILPEGQLGEFGIEGADEAIEAEIVALRDHEQPGKYANFWGTLRCDVIDYGGCQLLVTRIRSGTELTDPEPVEGWEGTIIGLTYDEPGAPQPDDAFILEGEYPVQYGIDSYIAENGWPIYREELESRRDTGQTIRVWGDLVCGFPDVNACQIRVRRLEADGAEVDAYEGWATYNSEFYGYHFRYPAGTTITERGPDGFPSEELPEGMSADEYLEQLTEKYSNQLCVGIHYSHGYIYILAPIDSEFRYAICGRTGVGAGELIDKTEEIFVAGEWITAEGFEFIAESDTLPYHNETLVLSLPDDTRIEYGASPVEGATYEDYLAEAKMVLLQILSTYEVTE